MKILYQCEICKYIYENREDAEKCEARKTMKYPVGMIYSGTDKNIILAIAQNYSYGHYIVPEAWIAWGNKYYRSYGGSVFHPPDPEIPAFQRMVDYLNSQGIPITVWDGEMPVSLEEFLMQEVDRKEQ